MLKQSANHTPESSKPSFFPKEWNKLNNGIERAFRYERKKLQDLVGMYYPENKEDNINTVRKLWRKLQQEKPIAPWQWQEVYQESWGYLLNECKPKEKPRPDLSVLIHKIVDLHQERYALTTAVPYEVKFLYGEEAAEILAEEWKALQAEKPITAEQQRDIYLRFGGYLLGLIPKPDIAEAKRMLISRHETYLSPMAAASTTDTKKRRESEEDQSAAEALPAKKTCGP
ncbi:MAG: hypothetical protein DHS20C09_21260 [marine bacterium B5-7]|nr:MAG: hypothetical protein DHS20C09_21260 [marine bacterium B5-7]